MNSIATVANAAWGARNLPAWWGFRAALHRPRQTQDALLRQIVRNAERTAFGRAHRFDRIDSYDDFVARAPLGAYDDFEPYINRIRDGEANVLTQDRVTRLATTSGTSSARKLIPYTRSLQAAFNRAVGPWIVDLFHRHPSLTAGRAYWSVSPVVRDAHDRASKVPIGFEDDSDYLGGVQRRLVDATMAVPATVRHATSMDAWRRMTIDHLSRCRDLRLISIWHPSFLTLLLDEMAESPESSWPSLRVISCWGDAQASLATADLQRRFPRAVVQPKGLIATEAIVSIPFAGQWPVAIRSHVFEFLMDNGAVRRPHELRVGDECEVVVTNGGGLFRYRLGDRIRVNAMVGRTPSIRFLGRSGCVSDRYGEKLSEPFVAATLNRVSESLRLRWTFAMLAPHGDRYALYVEGDVHQHLAHEVDVALCANPHYAYCLDLGQLKTLAVFHIERDAQANYLAMQLAVGQRLGDIKPTALSLRDDWQQVFRGAWR